MPRPFVLMGHSLGGNFALATAADTVGGAVSDLRAVVLLDAGSFDNGAQASAALSVLTGANWRPVLDVASPPGTACKLGDLVPALVAARPGQFVGVQLVNGLHLDSIGYSNLVGNLI